MNLPTFFRFLLIGVCCNLSPARGQQDINFDDLKRQGRPLVRTISVPGVGDEGTRLMKQFDEIDTDRVAVLNRERAEARDRAESQPSTGKSDTQLRGRSKQESRAPEKPAAAPQASGPKTWACKIYCKSASGPVITRTVPAESRAAAARIVEGMAHQLCNEDGKSHASKFRFSENQCTSR